MDGNTQPTEPSTLARVSRIAHVRELLAEAERTNERRVVVLSGSSGAAERAMQALLDEVPIGIAETVVVSSRLDVTCRRIDPARSGELMGSEARLIVIDGHESLIPNVLGRCGGAVVGGGLLVLLCPPLSRWPSRRDEFDRSLVVEPFSLDDVTGWFREWMCETLETHPGIAIIDVDRDELVKSGLSGTAATASERGTIDPPAGATFPSAAYRRCRTDDQRRVLARLETIREPPSAVIIQADRGRGKSSVAGLAAGALVADGYRIAVTAPEAQQAAPLVDRAVELLEGLGLIPHTADRGSTAETAIGAGDGRLAFVPPGELIDHDVASEWDAIFADEAAGLPVPTLTAFLAVPRVVCTTTLHGYEGSGQGFATRFMAALEDAPHAVVDVTMTEPIRYAAADPLEGWLNRVLLLDARPAVDDAIDGARPETVSYGPLEPEMLIDEPEQFREAIGLLAMAHYRTEPDDVARLLDAPNLDAVGLWHHGHVAAIALIASEGGLPERKRLAAYRGERLRGNLVPDVLLNEYRDLEGAGTRGARIVRIATHPAVRRRGLATQLLEAITTERGADLDWLGAGFGATPGLVDFWATNGFVPIFLSASRNASSGSYSVVMLQGVSSTGTSVVDRHAAAFPQRLRSSLGDVHQAVDPAVVDATFDAMVHRPAMSLSSADWRFVAAVGFGPGRYDLNPAPLKSLVVHHLAGDPSTDSALDSSDRRLLIAKVLQCRPWDEVATAFGFHSVGNCRRALRDAVAPLATAYGDSTVETERERLDARTTDDVAGQR